MPSVHQRSCRAQLCSYHGRDDGLAIVALYTNSAPMSISPASAASCSRSNLAGRSLMDGQAILFFGKHRTSNIEHRTSNKRKMAKDAIFGCWVLGVGCWMFFHFHFADAEPFGALEFSVFKIAS